MTDAATRPDDVAPGVATKVRTDMLALDRQNPRLLGVSDSTSEAEIIAQLYRSEDLGEILQSIAANGYLDIEPLIVKREDDRLVVLEGNRRLADMQLFLNPVSVEDVNNASGLRVSLPEISSDKLDTLGEVTVHRVVSRDDARSFIGFKHINGAARWASFAKAKFAAQWFRDEGVDLSTIAERIGDRHDTIKRMVNAIFVLEQAEKAGKFDLEDRALPKFNFSHLYTALSRANYMEFLGLETACTNFNPEPNPVDEINLDKLGEVLRWIYGSKSDEVEPVIQSQNPDIKDLGHVLCSAEGLTVLRATGSLSEAVASTQSAQLKLSESLVRARVAIREASHNLRGFDGTDSSLVDIAEDISESAMSILARMNAKLAADPDQ